MTTVKRIQQGFLLVDVFVLHLSTVIGHQIRYWGKGPGLSHWALRPEAVTFVLVMLYMFYLSSMYSVSQKPSLIRRINFSFTFGLIPLSFLAFAMPSLAFGRGWFLATYPTAMLLTLLWRHFVEPAAEKYMPRERVLVIGTGPSALDVIDLLAKNPHVRYDILGFVPIEGNRILVPKEKILPADTDIPLFALQHGVGKVVVAADDRRGSFPIPELLECKMAGIDVMDVPTMVEVFESKISLNIHSSALIFSHGFRRSRIAMALKNTMDKVLAVVGLLLSAPFFVVLPLLIKLDSPGPVFFRQTRVGRFGKPFTILKFRSMRVDAEADGAKWALPEDSRATCIGAVLRKTRLDELPQMINVLNGTMSFVGPRPEVPPFVERLRHTLPYYDQRHVVKPGITGWAQVKYRYGASAEDSAEKLEYDLYYIKHFSILLDILIIFETIRSVLLRRGSR